MILTKLLIKGADHALERRFEEAWRCFRAAQEIAPGNLAALNGLGVCLHELGRLDEAEHVLSLAIRQAPNFTDAHYNLGLVHLERNRCDHALACFEEVLCKKPADADSLAATGIALERKGELADAEEYFAEAALFSRTYAVANMLRFSTEFLRRIDSVDAVALPPMLQLDSGAAGALVVLASCDRVYLRKYGPAFARSFAQYAAPTTLIHLHLIDPEAAAVQEAQTILARAGITRYRISTEHASRFAPGSRARTVWYACARFSLLEWCLRAYDAPTIVLDIDAAIQRPLSNLLDAQDAAELGLFLRQPRRAPWLDIRACVLVARSTWTTLRFARLLRNYVEYFMELGAPEWHLDQCALYCTLRMLDGEDGAPAVRSISEAANKTVFQVGHSYDGRMADPQFAQFTSRN